MNLSKTIEKAKGSSFYLWLFNRVMNRMIPFNRPHGFKVVEITDHTIKTRLPYRKSNFNHIKGLHACSLATITEFTAGLMLLSKLDASKYRLILKTLEMDYLYQGKMDAFGKIEMSDNWLTENIYKPLQSNDSVVINCEVKIHDGSGSHLTTGRTYWQIKSWSKVKTKVS